MKLSKLGVALACTSMVLIYQNCTLGFSVVKEEKRGLASLTGLAAGAAASIDFAPFYVGNAAALSNAAIFHAPTYYEKNAALFGGVVPTDANLAISWLNQGILEGRRASPTFDVRQYLNLYPQLRYELTVNAPGYVAGQPVSSALQQLIYIGAANHYLIHGVKEGRAGIYPLNLFDGRIFNVDAYRRYNPSLGSDAASLRSHWISHGVREGRRAHDKFSVSEYIAINGITNTATGIAAEIPGETFEQDYVWAMNHYLNSGFRAGLIGANGVRPTAAADVPVVKTAGAPGIVFDAATQTGRCAVMPDGPLRPFIDSEGQVQAIFAGAPSDLSIQSGPLAFRFIGSTTPRTETQANFDCAGGSVLPSALDPNWQAFRPHEWLMGLYSDNGQIVHGLVHGEYHGTNPNGQNLLAGDAEFDHNNTRSVTSFISTDAGRRYYPNMGSQSFLVASIGAAPSATFETGPSEPSNIIKKDGYYYAYIYWYGGRQPSFRGQDSGVCVMRTPDIADGSSWRAWNGTDFTADLAKGQKCQVLAGIGGLHDSITYNTVLKKYLLVGFYGYGGNPELSYSTSDDLVHWSQSRIIDASFKAVSASPTNHGYGYASVVDDEISAANFDVSGANPVVYVSYFENGFTKRIYRVPLRVQ